MSDELLARVWDTYDWEEAEQSLLELQQQLTKAVFRCDEEARVSLQKSIVRLDGAKMLAVRHVCATTSGPGVDGVRWTTSADKMRAAQTLTSKDYRAMPMRMNIIRQKNGKERHINVPTKYDRAMQVLYAFSLDPVAEAVGERKSFAFRKGRSAMDAHAKIMEALSGSNIPEYLILTDVKACYGSISHDWLLKNIPMDTRILREFLKSGHVFMGELFPPDEFGISLGANLSPILGNMVLDKMQSAIYARLHPNGIEDYTNGNLIRFADDVFITARTDNDAKTILLALSSFLSERGLTLSADKTKIIMLRDGFDFLSRHYELRGNTITARPSDAAITKAENELRELILPFRGSQKSLIEKLNQKLNGWASYHKATDATDAFRHIDVVVKTLLLQLCESKHYQMPRKKIIDKYFYRESNGEYIYALKSKPDVRVIRLGKTILTQYRPVKTNINPYLDIEYIDDRINQRSIENVVGKYKTVWMRQNGKCHYCGRSILSDQQKSIVPLDASKELLPKNMAYIHKICSSSEVILSEINIADINSPVEIRNVLEKINGETKRRRRKTLKFDPLNEYFRQRTEPVFTLTFSQICEIVGDLCSSAYKYKDYWYRAGFDRISETWLSNGYKIRKLHMDKKKVVFERTTELLVPINIPEVFLRGKMPADAVAELENFFLYVRKKYGV